MPLDSWTCDACGDEITNKKLGLLTWRETDFNAHDFLIVHKNVDGRTCDPGFGNGYASSIVLDNATGPVGQSLLLAMLSVGPLKGGSNTPKIQNFDQFVEVFRRLQTAWYEEARPHLADELTHHWLGDANEYFPYTPEVLERIAKGTLG